TFDVLCNYFGTPGPVGADMRVWATRLFEFQFADQAGDPALRVDVDRFAPLLREHVDGLIEQRKGAPKVDDLLGRCLELQAAGTPGMDSATIRTNLVGLIVGGLPQPPLVLPQAMEQLLRRPAVLEEATAAARAGDDARLGALVFEALRFDPLAPALVRIAAEDYVVAAGTWRARRIARGATVFAAVRSAMHDGRRVPHPGRFDAGRPAYQYMHFGYGMHSCFFMHVNSMLLPLILKPLLACGNVRRAEGAEGSLSKRGIFPERLVVRFG
ncbi:MAG: cytochrome P450, partial [Acidobacteriota bacterium]|nr:cytochrome P450 [Acidobacteriota bacterium]